MIEDLSIHHGLIGNLFAKPATAEEWSRFRLSDEQVKFYRENGYLAGVNMLDDAQVDALCEELRVLVDPAHPGHGLFHEFNSNESADPAKVHFHALGAWRISPAATRRSTNPFGREDGRPVLPIIV